LGDELKPVCCYVSPASGKNKIAEWYEGLLAQERADADEFIKNMRKTQDWSMPDYRPRLVGHKGLGELRWRSEEKQHRLVGYLKGGMFFALIGCTHKQQVYNPANALDTADKRKKEIESGKARTIPYDL
jgi:hypothetical protein